MSYDKSDPDYDPDRWLIDWKPDEPAREITCTCGATLTLLHLFNQCGGCGAQWDRWAHLILPGRKQDR